MQKNQTEHIKKKSKSSVMDTYQWRLRQVMVNLSFLIKGFPIK
jgi:hypothetical protein